MGQLCLTVGVKMAEGAAFVRAMPAQIAAQTNKQRIQAGVDSQSSASDSSGVSKPSATRTAVDGAALKVNERIRVAKARRDEQERQQAARESQIQERERRNRMQYERQVQKRQRKLEEQRQKEDQRRTSVEEKRKQKLEEEKEHYEAVLRRTQERSHKLEQKQKRWSWGGGVAADSGDCDGATASPVAIAASPCSSDELRKKAMQRDSRCSSASVSKQQADATISKRLSSSANLMNASDKSSTPKPRSSSLSRAGSRCQSSPKVEKRTKKDQDSSSIGHLLNSTQSIPRSKSERSDTQASASPLHTARGPMRSRSIDRQKAPVPATGAEGPQNQKEKRFSSPGAKNPASPSTASGRRSPSPASSSAQKRPPSPAAPKQAVRSRPPSPGASKQRPPSPQPTSKPPPIQRPALTPTGPPTLRKRDSKPKENAPVQPLPLQATEATPTGTTHASRSKEATDLAKGTAGTTSAEAAAKILAENRRLAREQKERDEQLRLHRQEEERLRKEEEKRQAEEERLRRREEERRRAEERQKREEEQVRVEEEEKIRLEARELERQAELQREREEAESRAVEEAEKQRRERERIMQRNQQERMERRKRIEEIMKRTRKTDLSDYKKDEEGDLLEEPEDGGGQEELESFGEQHEGDLESVPPFGMSKMIELDNKEYEETCQEGPAALRHVAKDQLLEDSAFVKQDTKVGLVPGVNGKVGPWNLDIIDLAMDSNGPSGGYDEKGSNLSALHPSHTIEALSEI